MQLSGLLTARMKISQIPYICHFSGHESLFLKFWITLQCHDTWYLWNFLAETLYAFDKKSPSMYNFSHFECSTENLPNSSCHFWNHTVRNYSNFTSLFSVMKDNSLHFCSSNLAYLGQKGPIAKKCSDFRVAGWKFNQFLMPYLKPQVCFSLNFASLFSVMRDYVSVLF